MPKPPAQTASSPAKTAKPQGEKPICQNRRATFDYLIEERVEAGVVLMGTEIKSLRAGGGSLAEAYAQVKGGEAWIMQFHIPPYEQGNIHNADPVRPRKLLLHRREIDKLAKHVERKGYALVPTRAYLKGGRVKIEIGLGRGKKLYDKRESIKQRDHSRDMDRARRQR